MNLLRRFCNWWTLDRGLAVACLAACLAMAFIDGDATLLVVAGILLTPGLLLGW